MCDKITVEKIDNKITLTVTDELKKHIEEVEVKTLNEEEIKTPYLDSSGVPTIGVGHALVVKINGKWKLREDFPSAISADDKKTIEGVVGILNSSSLKDDKAEEIRAKYGSRYNI